MHLPDRHAASGKQDPMHVFDDERSGWSFEQILDEVNRSRPQRQPRQLPQQPRRGDTT